MVWIHGGGYLGGGGVTMETEGSHMRRWSVTVVSFNYRSARSGYLAHTSLEATSVSKNKLAVLQWCEENISMEATPNV